MTVSELLMRADRLVFTITKDGVRVEIEVADGPTVQVWGEATEGEIAESYAMFPAPEGSP